MPKQKSIDLEAHQACIDRCTYLYSSNVSDNILKRIYKDLQKDCCLSECSAISSIVKIKEI